MCFTISIHCAQFIDKEASDSEPRNFYFIYLHMVGSTRGQGEPNPAPGVISYPRDQELPCPHTAQFLFVAGGGGGAFTPSKF